MRLEWRDGVLERALPIDGDDARDGFFGIGDHQVGDGPHGRNSDGGVVEQHEPGEGSGVGQMSAGAIVTTSGRWATPRSGPRFRSIVVNDSAMSTWSIGMPTTLPTSGIPSVGHVAW